MLDLMQRHKMLCLRMCGMPVRAISKTLKVDRRQVKAFIDEFGRNPSSFVPNGTQDTHVPNGTGDSYDLIGTSSLTLRSQGLNPRNLGTNPRAQGNNPHILKQNNPDDNDYALKVEEVRQFMKKTFKRDRTGNSRISFVKLLRALKA